MSATLPLVRKSVSALSDRAIATRRHLHRHPELSWNESATQQLVLDRLRALDIEDVRPIARTGATALVRGQRAEPCVLWRADMDALPIEERSGLPFSSEERGVMHACGHDAHTAIALGLAELLAANRTSLPGSVRLVFQPAEEADGGAAACLADGVLDGPWVSRVLGLHVSADLPIGSMNVAPGPFFAAPTTFRVQITGRGGHAAAPHQSVDAVVVAAHIVVSLQSVVSRSVAPAESAVLTVGQLKAGVRSNVIAESAVLTGTIRTYSDALRAQVIARTEELIAGVCVAFGADYRFDHTTSCPPLVNDEAVAGFVRAHGERYFGREHVVAAQSMGADDMAVFLQQRPGCYFWLGARNEAEGIAGRHHDAGFVIDERAIPLGMEFALRLIEGSLGK